MRFNECTAVSCPDVLLVPYDRRHVVEYHRWMEDAAIREATASDRLTLEEEYANQASWRAAHDKLTFILCLPLSRHPGGEGRDAVPDGGPQASLDPDREVKGPVDSLDSVKAGEVDGPDKMLGDINFFLHPYDSDSDSDPDPDDNPKNDGESRLKGEIDIMIAAPAHRRKGLGRAAVSALLHYILRHLDGITAEHARHAPGPAPRLAMLVAKINKDNAASIALFRGLGFAQRGAVNYFGEVEMVLSDLESVARRAVQGYRELRYVRDSGGEA